MAQISDSLFVQSGGSLGFSQDSGVNDQPRTHHGITGATTLVLPSIALHYLRGHGQRSVPNRRTIQLRKVLAAEQRSLALPSSSARSRLLADEYLRFSL